MRRKSFAGRLSELEDIPPHCSESPDASGCDSGVRKYKNSYTYFIHGSSDSPESRVGRAGARTPLNFYINKYLIVFHNYRLNYINIDYFTSHLTVCKIKY